jgi:hypothetical protein
VQYYLYHAFLRGPLRTGSPQQARPAVNRWLTLVFLWQVIVVGVAAAYVAVLASMHIRGYAWIAPPIAAVFGTALPLQVAVIAILRAGRGS